MNNPMLKKNMEFFGQKQIRININFPFLECLWQPNTSRNFIDLKIYFIKVVPNLLNDSYFWLVDPFHELF